jgi:CheY-like chemotaxis protein
MPDLTETITSAHKYYVQGQTKFSVFEFLLEKLLILTESKYGFIGEILYKDEIPFLRTNAITNIAWTKELNNLYHQKKNIGMDFMSLDNLFGLVITENSIIISNDPLNDKRRGGKLKIPEGHPSLNSFAGIPFYHNKKIIGMVGIANKPLGYTKEYLKSLDPFYDTCSTLISAYKIQDDYKNMERQNNTFISQASHDMRTPLNGIFGYCQLLEMTVDKHNYEIHDYIKSISNCSDVLLGLIDNILSITKTFIDIKFANINLHSFVKEMIKMVEPIAARNNIKLIDNVNIDCTILVDKKIIGIVFSNLLTNAIKYNKNGGCVTITADIIDSENINIGFLDTGMGIEQKELNLIFDPFYRGNNTSHVEGNGLGLAIVKKYVVSMDGNIIVDSELGIGSKFTLKLKYKSNCNKYDNILYIEDDIINQKLMKNIIKIHKFNLDIASNINEAITKINDNEYKLFIIDLNLPYGLGTDIIPYIENVENIIILTADASNNTKKKIHDLNIKHYVTKPFNIKEFILTIKQIINKE